jgi:nicotinamidase/pyrazinamidase
MLFWDVDTQKDFLVPGGRLYVAGAEKIIPNLGRLAAWAAHNSIRVVSSACAHKSGDPELQVYGPHCMSGSPGQQKVPETLLPNRFVVPNRPVQLPDLKSFQQVIIEKQAFDVFSNPNTEQVVQQFGKGFHPNPPTPGRLATPGLRIVMYGVTTDICVARAAYSLLERCHKVELVTDAIAALDQQEAAAFLEDFVARGGKLVKMEEIVSKTRAA